MKTTIISFLAFIIFSMPLFGFDGYWEQRFPENPPPARITHAMASIGDRKVIMINGSGFGIDYNDTWLYDYDSNTWTEIDCETPPYTNPTTPMRQISKNRVLWSGGYSENPQFDKGIAETWLFDLDSLRWFKLDLATSPPARRKHGVSYLSEGKFLLYGGGALGLQSHMYYDTWVATLNENEPIDSPNFITWEKKLDLRDGDISPDIDLSHFNLSQQPQFVDISDGKSIFIAGNPENYKYYNEQVNKWIQLKIKKNSPVLYWAGSRCKLTENIVLSFGGYTTELINDVGISIYSNKTDLLVFTPEDTVLNAYTIDCTDKPGGHYYGAAAQIDDGIVIAFGGYWYKKINKQEVDGMYNDTWIFHLTDRTDPYTSINEEENNNKIYYLGNNIYQLENIKELELYDLTGRLIKSYFNKSTIDLNYLQTGMYFLKYKINKNIKVEKVIRY